VITLNRTPTRLLALILALFTILPAAAALTSCGGGSGSETADTTTAGETASGEDTAAEPDILDGLGFNGASYRIQMSVTDISSDEYMMGPEEETGDIALDAVYARNLYVQEKLDVNLEYTESNYNWSDVYTQVSKLILAGDDAFELIVNDQIGLATVAIEKMFVNVYDCPYFDFEEEGWWYSYMRDLTIGNDRMYLLVGDYFIDVLRKSHVLYYNRELFETFNGDPDALYRHVLDGEWTYEKLIGYIETAYADLDGDGTKSLDDQYGFIVGGIGGSIFPFSYSADADFITRDADGIPEITMNNERADKLYTNIYNVFYNDASLNKGYGENSMELANKFIGGTALFISGAGIGDFERFRAMTYDMGLVPYPKLDETQDEHITVVHDTAEIGGIPITCKNLELASAVLQLLCRESYRTVNPAYYETTLKIKYVRDDYSAQMIDIVHDGLSGLFTLVYGAAHCNNIFTWAFLEPLQAGNPEWMSAYAKREEAAVTGLQTLVDAYMS